MQLSFPHLKADRKNLASRIDQETELRILRVLKRLNEEGPTRILPTLLAAHTVPPEFAQNRTGYIRLVIEEIIPGSDCQSDAQMKEEIRLRGVSNLHPVGTCRMGREVDSVVDPRLRVHGIDGLRVADASIMPSVPCANTNLPTIMIGEKVASILLNEL